jgi:hypothetical protein
MTIEAAVKQTHSTTVEDYRAKLMARITGLYSFCEFASHYSRRLGLTQLLEQRMRPYSANGAQVISTRRDVELEPPLARSALRQKACRRNAVPEQQLVEYRGSATKRRRRCVGPKRGEHRRELRRLATHRGPRHRWSCSFVRLGGRHPRHRRQGEPVRPRSGRPSGTIKRNTTIAGRPSSPMASALRATVRRRFTSWNWSAISSSST